MTDAKRCLPIPAALRWTIFGALFAGGAIVVARIAGPPTIRKLGADAGQGVAEGMAKFQAAQRELAATVAGRW